MITQEFNSEMLKTYGRDGYFELNLLTRTLVFLTYGGQDLGDPCYLGVQNDNNIQHILFRIPQYLEGVNFATATHVYIFFKTSNVQPIRITLNMNNAYIDTLNEYIYLDWVITKEITQYFGDVYFSLCLQEKNEAQEIKWELNSESAEAIIAPGLSSTIDIPHVDGNTYEQYDTWRNYSYTYRLDMDSTLHPEYFNDQNCIYMENEMRDLTLPESYHTFGLERDHMIAKFYVAFDKWGNSGDIYPDQTWEFYAQYTNAKNQSDNSKLNFIKEDHNYLYYVWYIPIGVTQYAGVVDFSFAAIKKSGDGKVANVLNSGSANAFVESTITSGSVLDIITIPDEILMKKIVDVLSNSHIIFNGNVW